MIFSRAVEDDEADDSLFDRAVTALNSSFNHRMGVLEKRMYEEFKEVNETIKADSKQLKSLKATLMTLKKNQHDQNEKMREQNEK